MEIIEISDKPFMAVQLREECLLQAVLFYREYDEEYDIWTPYAYQFPKDEELIDEVNALIPSSAFLQLQKKFVTVVSDQKILTQQQLQVTIQQN